MTAAILTSIFEFFVNLLTSVPPAGVYAIVFALAFGEAALFVGFVLPGETAVLLGGVAASQDHVNVVVLCVGVAIAAIAGDSIGYWIGKNHGDKLLKLPIVRHRKGAIHHALELLRQRGPVYVFLGRFTAFLRAVMPGLAGMSHMPYRQFFIANAASGIVWGVGFTLLGYLSGHALPTIEKYVSRFGIGILILVFAGGIWHHVHAKRKAQAIEAEFQRTHPDGVVD
jgi:membrane protein DedA with SNARE-associated domain